MKGKKARRSQGAIEMSEMDLSEFTDARKDSEQDDSEDAEWFDFDGDGDSITGELVRVQEDAGKYDSRLYEIDVGEEKNRLVWGNGSIDAQVDDADVETGDMIHIEQDGTYSNQYGTFDAFRVMFKKA